MTYRTNHKNRGKFKVKLRKSTRLVPFIIILTVTNQKDIHRNMEVAIIETGKNLLAHPNKQVPVYQIAYKTKNGWVGEGGSGGSPWGDISLKSRWKYLTGESLPQTV